MVGGLEVGAGSVEDVVSGADVVSAGGSDSSDDRLAAIAPPTPPPMAAPMMTRPRMTAMMMNRRFGRPHMRLSLGGSGSTFAWSSPPAGKDCHGTELLGLIAETMPGW